MFISFINRLHPSMYADGLDTKTMQYFTWLQVNILFRAVYWTESITLAMVQLLPSNSWHIGRLKNISKKKYPNEKGTARSTKQQENYEEELGRRKSGGGGVEEEKSTRKRKKPYELLK